MFFIVVNCYILLYMICRDIKDMTVGTLSQRITSQLMGLKGLESQLNDVSSYLERVSSGQLPANHQIIYQLQDIFNLLPDVQLNEFVRAMFVKTNDQHLVIYIAALVRSIIALHNLINNKLQNRDVERSEGKDTLKEKRKLDSEGSENKHKNDKKEKSLGAENVKKDNTSK